MRLNPEEKPLYLTLALFSVLILSLWAAREKTPDIFARYAATMPEIVAIGSPDQNSFSAKDFRTAFLNIPSNTIDLPALFSIKKPALVFLFARPPDNQEGLVSFLTAQNIPHHILSRPSYETLRPMGARVCEFKQDGTPQEIAYKRLLLNLALQKPDLRTHLNLPEIGQFIETHKKPCPPKN